MHPGRAHVVPGSLDLPLAARTDLLVALDQRDLLGFQLVGDQRHRALETAPVEVGLTGRSWGIVWLQAHEFQLEFERY